MKKFKLEVTEEIFTALGFTLPTYPNRGISDLKDSESDFNYLRNNLRVSSLVRSKNTYKSLQKKMNAYDLLKLTYNHIPDGPYQRYDYFFKKIEKFIHTKFLSCSKQDSQYITLANQILGIYQDFKTLEVANPEDDVKSNIAFHVFNSKRLLRTVCNETDFEMLSAIGSAKKIKPNYYFFRINKDVQVYLINLNTLYAYIAFLNCLYSLVTDEISPLIRNILEEQYQKVLTEQGDTDDTQILYNLIYGKQPIPISVLFKEHIQKSEEKLYFFAPKFTLMSKLMNIFCEVVEIYQEIDYENTYQTERHKKIATAYITKKNIPEHIQAAMKNSKFLKYFGYVEYDADVDLSAIEVIMNEFQLLSKEFFYDQYFPEVSLRFRKLGKHKANGLYYPYFQTLCVDIHSPSSFVHEYWHMIDSQLGDLSLEVKFNHIVTIYRQAFLRDMKTMDDELKNKINGRSKYNIKYFFRRAEIFARCGEIYFTRILKVKSSLLKPDLLYAYPESQELDQSIEAYYKELLADTLSNLPFKKVS